MSRRLHIVATSGFAKETAQLADAICRVTPYWDEIVYISEDKAEVGRKMSIDFSIRAYRCCYWYRGAQHQAARSAEASAISTPALSESDSSKGDN